VSRAVNRTVDRWLRFGAVGAIGISVQLAALAALTGAGVQYLLATGLAVETALLHNYIWHVRWTWKDRAPKPGQLCRFHLANGLISLLSNLLWMRLLTGWLHVPVLSANLMAIAATAALNFTLGDRWVFASRTARADARLQESKLP